MILEFQRCTRSATNFFIGLHPPRTLEVAKAKAPTVTPAADGGFQPHPAMPVVTPEHPAFKTKKSQAYMASTPTPATDLQQDKPPSGPNQQDPVKNDPKAENGDGGSRANGKKQQSQDPPSQSQQGAPKDRQSRDPAGKAEDPANRGTTQGGSPNNSDNISNPAPPTSQGHQD